MVTMTHHLYVMKTEHRTVAIISNKMGQANKKDTTKR
jgi:hypothetical protein